MLAHILALAVAIGSIAIYLAAFFFPEVHRKNDFIWSGVGLFYGLVLWVFARRITGGLLLGHVASVALLGWFGWQTISLRRQIVPQAQKTPIPTSAEIQSNVEEQVTKSSIGERVAGLTSRLGGIFAGVKKKPATTPTKATDSTILDKSAIDAIATADESVSTEEVPATETGEQPTDVAGTISTEEVIATETGEQPTDVAGTIEATTTEATPENRSELTPPPPPPSELEQAAESQTEEQTPPATAEVVPDGELSPPAEPTAEEKPPGI
ncbi:Ycf66 family protein [Calothrix rhizosoleniae]|uniref:Ycf66 family protein n=1 Tax=Calothrix rhizosoleniae TaxID=888997 RepID=UPI000B49B8F1|nr:Ycf66 family protein [Calothrix rhizosoleniae]